MTNKTEVTKVLEKVDKLKAYLPDERLEDMRLPLTSAQIHAFGMYFKEKYERQPLSYIDIASRETGMDVYES